MSEDPVPYRLRPDPPPKPAPSPSAVIAKVVSDWQRENVSLATPDMIRFGMCVHFALLGSGATKPSLDAATAEHDVALASIRQAVRQGPCSAPRIVAIKKYRELAGSTLEEAKAWVDENPASYDLRIRLPNEA